jgi:hypothetical protein
VSEPIEKPPFAAHPRYYLVLKLVVLAAAVLLAVAYLSSALLPL